MFALESVNAALERRDAKTLLKCLRLPHLGLRDIKDENAEFYLNRLTEIREYKQVETGYIPSFLHLKSEWKSYWNQCLVKGRYSL